MYVMYYVSGDEKRRESEGRDKQDRISSDKLNYYVCL
jgi:hypothetical protein